jgi:hypothetical protein
MKPRTLKAKMLVGMFTFAAMLAGLSAASAVVSCASVPDDKRFTAMIGPNYPAFRDSVDPYIEKQCGTLDCHGQPGRGFRVYGFRGLRLYSQEAGLIPGVQQTTPEEVNANYFALISVEPETFNRVMARNGTDPDVLLFLRKAMNLERHKGGALFAKESAPYRCITAWLRLPQDPNATLGTTDQAFCDKAKTQP